MSAGRRLAAKVFKDAPNDVFLYTDLDREPEKKAEWFVRMETENPNEPIIFTQDKAERIFFMIQEMEAWLLKQLRHGRNQETTSILLIVVMFQLITILQVRILSESASQATSSRIF